MKIVIADDHPIIRWGIRNALSRSEEYQVVGDANEADEAIKLVEQHLPDLLILDIQMPGSTVDEIAHRALEVHSKLKILIVSSQNDPKILRRLPKEAVAGYLLKEEAPESLLQAVRSIAQGASWFSHPVAASMLALTQEPQNGPGAQLTPRERQILARVAAGRDNSAIALELSLAEQTVRNYTSVIYSKLGVSSRPEAVVYAQTHGLAAV